MEHNRLIEIIKYYMKYKRYSSNRWNSEYRFRYNIIWLMNFNKINAIEYNEDNYEALKNNIKVLGYEKY
jgi:hypothetical protein